MDATEKRTVSGWLQREIAMVVAEMPENVEARVRESGFIMPDPKPSPPLPWHKPTVQPLRYRTGPLIPLPPLGDGD